MALQDALADPTRRPVLVQDAVAELEAELAERSGFSAIALRTAYKAVDKLRPRMIEDNIDRLLPRFAPVLDTHYQVATAAGDVDGHFRTHADEIAESLLSATDARANEANNAVAKKAYAKLRPKAKDNVVDGMPRLARLLAKHAG